MDVHITRHVRGGGTVVQDCKVKSGIQPLIRVLLVVMSGCCRGGSVDLGFQRLPVDGLVLVHEILRRADAGSIGIITLGIAGNTRE